MTKRLFDILASGIGLLFLSPFLLIIAICIKLGSKGPVLYSQIRVGKDNKNFSILKFRSMRVDADKEGGLITIGARDPRVTPLGYFMRKYKIDELPQLINVLIGDMSLVGPRPEVRHYVDMYTPEQRFVLSVRPGLTDIATIKYKHENEILGEQDNPNDYYIHVIMPDKLRLNLEYVNNHGFITDLRLVARTLFGD